MTAPSSTLNLDRDKTAPKPGTQFVARQPILTTDEKVFGYELLFRDGIEDFFQSSDPDAASRSTLNTSMLIGLDVLCDGHRAFVNCTRETLLKDYMTLLPSEQAVVEVLETVPADDLVVAACRRLKEAGYVIALDDFAMDDPREALTDLADIIKVALRATSAADAAAMVKRYGPWRCRMLAEKVETREEFVTAKKAGFLYFQGYFFRRPEVLTSHEIPANQLNYLRMLTAVSQPELDVREIENLVKSEAALLPPAALPELRRLWSFGRDPFGAACAGDSGRTGSPPLDSFSGDTGCRPRQNYRSRARCPGSRPFL
jgi:c-di-GMP-related signal transduction protein